MTNQDKKTLENLELNNLYAKHRNKFELTVAVSQRARQIKDGAKPLVDVGQDPVIPVVAALHELDDQKVNIIFKEEGEEAIDDIIDRFDKELDEELEDVLEEDVKAATAKKNKAKKGSDKKKSKSLSA